MAEESVAAPEQLVVLTTPPDFSNHDAKKTMSPMAPAQNGSSGNENKVAADQSAVVTSAGSSFREDTIKITDLPENEKKALVEFKQLIQNALKNHEFITFSSPPPSQPQSCPTPPQAVPHPKDVEEKSPEVDENTDDEKTKENESQVPETSTVLDEEKANEKKEAEKSKADENLAVPASEPQDKQVIPEETVTVATTNEDKGVDSNPAKADDDMTKTVEAILDISVVSESSSTPEKEEKSTIAAIDHQSCCSLPPPHYQQEEEKVSIYGIPLFEDDRTDIILWKFLRARDFKVKEAFKMFTNTLKWRQEFKIDELATEVEELKFDVDEILEKKVVFMKGVSKQGHPVCYNVYGEFEDKELYSNIFSDEEKRGKFLKWRILFLEKSIRKLLDFSSSCGVNGGIGGSGNRVTTFVQVNDLKNSPGPSKWELRQATKQALHLLQDNYPEFVAKQVFINVPWWYMAVNKMISPFLTQRTKSKFVFAGPSKSTETLFNYISPEQVPVQYGGLSRNGDFSVNDAATQIIIKPSSKETVEFSVNEKCQLTWELRVLGWDVSYGAEFVPTAKDAYTVIIQKNRKIGPIDESIITNTFKVDETGKVVLTVDNSSSKKKKLLYRLKSKPSACYE